LVCELVGDILLCRAHITRCKKTIERLQEANIYTHTYTRSGIFLYLNFFQFIYVGEGIFITLKN